MNLSILYSLLSYFLFPVYIYQGTLYKTKAAVWGIQIFAGWHAGVEKIIIMIPWRDKRSSANQRACFATAEPTRLGFTTSVYSSV